MSEHTPGPWRQVSGNLDGVKAFGIAGADQPSGETGPVVCLVTTADAVNETDVANARLIMAAPDLLRELSIREGDLFFLIKAIEAGDPKPELLLRASDMLRDTRAVIAKATTA